MSSWSVLDLLSHDRHHMRAVIKFGYQQAEVNEGFLEIMDWKKPKLPAWAFLENSAALKIAQ